MSLVALVGSPVSLAWASSQAGAATLTITQPDGTPATGSPFDAGALAAHTVSFTPAQEGRHTLLWQTTSDKHADVLDIWPEDPHYLVSRADALERIGESSSASSARLDAVMLYIAAATAVVENITGPLIEVQTTWTEVPAFPARAIVLPHENITVTEVTVAGSQLAAGDYLVDASAGIVHSRSILFEDLVEVTYTAGARQIPPQARQACLEIFAHMWQSTRESGRPTTAGEDVAVTSMGYAIPKRALELLRSIPRAAGIA